MVVISTLVVIITMKVKDMAVQDDAELDALLDMEIDIASKDFCAKWDKWKPVAEMAARFLRFLFPPGEKVILLLIAVADSYCPKP
ncbi:hypothetical protein D3C77_500040 [compost metagenome]